MLIIKVSHQRRKPRVQTEAQVQQYGRVGIYSQCIEVGVSGKKIIGKRHQTWREFCQILLAGFSFKAGQGLTQQRKGRVEERDGILTNLMWEDSHCDGQAGQIQAKVQRADLFANMAQRSFLEVGRICTVTSHCNVT